MLVVKYCSINNYHDTYTITMIFTLVFLLHDYWGEPEQAPHRRELCVGMGCAYVNVTAVNEQENTMDKPFKFNLCALTGNRKYS